MNDEAELKTLPELAAEHGQVAPEHPDGHLYLWQHRVADVIHGWSVHEYHYQADPVRLTSEDYLAALESAKGDNVPHEGALVEPPSREELDARIVEASAALKAKKDELKAEQAAVANGEKGSN